MIERLTGAPPVRVLVGEKRHVTIDRALRLLELGASEAVAADSEGRMDTEALRDALQAGEGPTIVCAQTGEVNTGAFDDFDVEHTCECARRFAERIVELDGVELLNDVVLNQVLFRFDSDQRTDDVLRAVQDSGEVWMSGTAWDGRRAIRVSVSNWQTGEDEIDLALDSFRRASRHARQVSRR